MRKLKGVNTEPVKQKAELVTQVCDLRKLKEKLDDENTELRNMICVFQRERNTLVALMSKDSELEEELI